jgi:HNH endonuclease/NUMOD4 motif/NUMOD1 domain
MEEWKSLVSLGYPKEFEVSTHGNVRNIKTGNLLSKRIERDGYQHVSIGRSTFLIHTLVARVFIANPDSKPTVDHINRDRADNIVSNLRWATHKEQRNNQKPCHFKRCKPVRQIDLDTGEIIATFENINVAGKAMEVGPASIRRCCLGYNFTCMGFGWEFAADCFPDEVWERCNPKIFIDVFVSNRGRIWTIRNGPTYGSKDILGYMKIWLKNKLTGRPQSYSVHILVAQHFHPNPNLLKIVNHIDNNRSNNVAENLEWCTHSHNIREAFRTQGAKTRAKQVVQYDLDTLETIAIYDSLTQAALAIEGDSSAISAVCKGKLNKHRGCGWRYGGSDIRLQKPRGTPVDQLDPQTGEVIATYPSIKYAAQITGASVYVITYACKNTKTGWRYSTTMSSRLRPRNLHIGATSTP